MIVIYRVALLAVMSLAGLCLIVRYIFTPQYLRMLAAYRSFEIRIERHRRDRERLR